MMLLRCWTIVICAVFIATGASSGEVMKAVGDQVSFRPDKPLPSPVTSIIWKHRNSDGAVVKAIEWELDKGKVEILIPNLRFKDITTVDEKTGEITITNLKLEHSGVYFTEINSREQEQRFTLTVKEPVPQPKIKIEWSDDRTVAYLTCEYSEPIIWKNSAGETLKGSPIPPNKGESITVKNEGNPENSYTCTLDNSASKKTSDPVFKKDLFKAESGPGLWWIAIIVILIIIIVVLFVLYKCNKKFKDLVDGLCPCIKGKYAPAPTNSNGTPMDGDKSTQGSTERDNDVDKAKDESKQPDDDDSNCYVNMPDDKKEVDESSASDAAKN